MYLPHIAGEPRSKCNLPNIVPSVVLHLIFPVCCAVGVCARLQEAGGSVASLARNDRRVNSSAAATICHCMCVVYVTEDVQQHSRHFNGSWAAWGTLITLGMKSKFRHNAGRIMASGLTAISCSPGSRQSPPRIDFCIVQYNTR